jgi:hypothetical protein
VLVKTDGAMQAYKDVKLLGMANKTVVSEHWKKISKCILKGFIKGVIRESGVGEGSVSLIDVEHIRAKRTRPAQRARQEADGLGPTAPTPGSIENKVEAAHKISECPRGVQNPDHEISEQSGRLGKALELILKSCSFYDPGKAPHDLAEGVYTCACDSADAEGNYGGGGLRMVDYTAADERHNEHSNRIVRALIEYFFTPQDKEEALKIYDSCFHMMVKGGAETLSTGWKNASGTGITTVLNTVVFAVRELETTIMSMIMVSMKGEGELVDEDEVYEITYKMFRDHIAKVQDWDNFCTEWVDHGSIRKRQKVHLVDFAYKWIGPKFGDDGLAPATPYVSDDMWARAMRYCDRMDGFVRKLETCSAERGEPIEYLSRIYPNIYHTLFSHCKVEKAVAKLSISVNRDFNKFASKLRGYYLTDRHAPIVGAFLEAIAGMYGIHLDPFSESQLEALKHTDPEVYHRVAHGPYPYDGPDCQEMAYEQAAKDYGMTSGELNAFDNGLRQQHTWKGISEYLIPAKVMSPGVEVLAKAMARFRDPLAPVRKEDPPGVYRVAAADGGDPRIQPSPSVRPDTNPRNAAVVDALTFPDDAEESDSSDLTPHSTSTC